MISKKMILELAALLVVASVGPMADAKSKSAAKQSDPHDPIVQALSQGVDHIDGSKTPQPPALERRNPRYRLESGDVLDLQFQYTPEFDQTVTVQPDGFVNLKEVGDLHIEGETVPQVREQLQKAYTKSLANPVINVELKEFEKPYFLTLGNVQHPGKYDLRGATTVAAAIAMAGGLAPDAKHSQVLLFRRVNDQWASVTKVDLKHMLKSRSLSEDPMLRPGDMVYVPQNMISKIKPFVPYPSLGLWKPL